MTRRRLFTWGSLALALAALGAFLGRWYGEGEDRSDEIDGSRGWWVP